MAPYFQELFGYLPISSRLVTDEDIALGSEWATYVYHLPRKFNADVWAKFEPKWAENRFHCAISPCNATSIACLGPHYPDYIAEVPILLKLLSALRFVEDPSQADLFLVPALISALALPAPHNPYSAEDSWFAELLSLLPHLTVTPTRPHLFLATRDNLLVPSWVRSQPHVVTLGPGHLVVPSLNPLFDLQPRHYRNVPPAGRTTLVLAAFSLISPIRDLLHDQVNAYRGPGKVEQMVFKGRNPSQGLMETMARSVFVLCPPGDLPYQKRFFDALLNGAIPVVFLRECQDGPTWFSHLHPYKKVKKKDREKMDKYYILPASLYCPAREWLVNISYPTLPIPLASLVVQVTLRTLIAPKFNIIQHLAALPKEEVEEKLQSIARVRNWFVYDFEGTTPDAFSILLWNIHERLQLGKDEQGA